MREILFRGKASHPLNKNKWFYGSYFEKIEYGIGTAPLKEPTLIVSVPERSSGIGIVDVYKSTVGEYTGLTDTNGKKIFEGDILKIYEGSEDDGYKIRKVYSYGGVLCVDYETSEWDFNALAFLDSDNVFTFEVIGNIHDNPDLLGGDDK